MGNQEFTAPARQLVCEVCMESWVALHALHQLDVCPMCGSGSPIDVTDER